MRYNTDKNERGIWTKCSAWSMYSNDILTNDKSKPILNRMNHYVDCDNIMKRWRIKFVFKISLSPPNLIYKSPLHDCWSSFVFNNKYFPGCIFINCVFHNILENYLMYIVNWAIRYILIDCLWNQHDNSKSAISYQWNYNHTATHRLDLTHAFD